MFSLLTAPSCGQHEQVHALFICWTVSSMHYLGIFSLNPIAKSHPLSNDQHKSSQLTVIPFLIGHCWCPPAESSFLWVSDHSVDYITLVLFVFWLSRCGGFFGEPKPRYTSSQADKETQLVYKRETFEYNDNNISLTFNATWMMSVSDVFSFSEELLHSSIPSSVRNLWREVWI